MFQGTEVWKVNEQEMLGHLLSDDHKLGWVRDAGANGHLLWWVSTIRGHEGVKGVEHLHPKAKKNTYTLRKIYTLLFSKRDVSLNLDGYSFVL